MTMSESDPGPEELTPPDDLTDEQVVYWKELMNRVHAAVEGPDTLSESTLEQIAALAERGD